MEVDWIWVTWSGAPVEEEEEEVTLLMLPQSSVFGSCYQSYPDCSQIPGS